MAKYKYKKTNEIVDAVQFLGYPTGNTDDSFSDLPVWLSFEFGKRILFYGKPNTLDVIEHVGNKATINPKDYIMYTNVGTFITYTKSEFESSYEKIKKFKYKILKTK